MTEVVLDSLNEAMLIYDDSQNLVYSNPSGKSLFKDAVDGLNEAQGEEELN